MHQSTDSQEDDVKKAGCEEIFFEKVSSTTLDKRHQLRACISMLCEQDQLVIARLDRLGCSQVEVFTDWTTSSSTKAM